MASFFLFYWGGGGGGGGYGAGVHTSVHKKTQPKVKYHF